MMNAKPIILCGFMGTGKSTVGRLLAERLHRRFFDLDAEIIRRAGRDIPAIFASEGEPGFRIREREAACDLCHEDHTVVAVGGGAVLDPENLELFQRRGMLIALLADAETIWQRIGADPDRPLLQAPNPRARLTELLDMRRTVYESIPKRVQTDGLPLEGVVEKIIGLMASSMDSGEG